MIYKATTDDLDTILKFDKHIAKQELLNLINQKRVYIIKQNQAFAGWLRYNLFWDNTPFMNMLYVLDDFQKQGLGKQMVSYWENEMKSLGYKYLLTSTQSNETAKFFYEKLGYKNIGGFYYLDDPYEIIYAKKLQD
ncbi:MAG: GNAT family N-acetyltransferase [Clostridia bacterium]|nr:GNAT family N-acetyltransferase [Clostridia bacterium]